MSAERPSLTASLVAALRALYAAMPKPFNLAPDSEAEAFVPWTLAVPARVARHWPAAAPVLHAGLGVGLLGAGYHVALRTRAIDDALRRQIDRGATQLVLLGAGLDNRARRLPELADVTVFEVDHPTVQRHKQSRLAAAGLLDRPGAARRVVLVPLDFEQQRLEDTLTAAGYDPVQPSFWIWEGVVPYLSPAAIDQTLAGIAALSSVGSRVALTYHRPGPMGALEKVGAVLADVIGEPLRGSLTPAAMHDLLVRAGFTTRSDETVTDWAPQYWGTRPPGLREWERLVVAERRP